MTPICRSLHSCLIEYARQCPEKRLAGDTNGWCTVSQLRVQAETIGAALLEHGLQRGEVAALRAGRDVRSMAVLLALQAIGVLTVLTDCREPVCTAPAKFEPAIPVKAYISDEWGNGLELYIPDTDLRLTLEPGKLPVKELPLQDVDPKAPGFVIFTSGSTGQSKAVMLSQYNLVNNLIDSQPLGEYSQSDIALGALPLNHVFGLVLLAGTVVLRYGVYFPADTDIDTLLQTIAREKITRMNGVPSLYAAIAEKSGEYDLSSLRAGFIGGGPCTPARFEAMERALGMTLIPVYGMSECVGISCGDYREPLEKRAFGVGRFYAMNRGKILLEDGTEAPTGQEGEICVDGPARMVGYFGSTEGQTPYLHTGDLGYLDAEGVLHISGRKKEIIIRNGNNLSPGRIEAALLAIPGVEEAVVLGLPDDRAGEVPWAAVVCRENAPEDLMAGLDTCLAKNELPAAICRMDAIPYTSTGKPDKQKLREVLMAWKV